ncbi:Methionyl-tRNA formyltransferase [Ignavibacterium album JCM 16511]|uniref:Methionyl-tRNA formyltransferase n=1 Tax=Ignavibacterium album (strain DSM 19864 / JCM 16511 / NBRC 101810 / Mat9-16) TaxID=945713 RepID=I0ALJ8_IGNAJ|nr:methionyl-tRNA formyltransferase [Ignavibacterium album]AFH49855.1 Methionyl-tRNA formyltransferase [Ignavibacterium album JCM 16511]
MKIVFMGTPDFAIPSLKAVYHSNHQLIGVVTTPDKERGRGQKVTFTPVKKFAVEHNIPVYQPEKLKDNSEFIEQLKNLQPDLFVVVAFRILPKEIFEIPKYGSFNLHASLLPKYRGAAPIQWALINGETETGLTTFRLAEQVDTGNIYLQLKVQIHPEDNFGTLHDRLSELGAEVVIKTIDLIESGNYQLLPQDDSLASPAPKITKEICMIEWNKPAEEIHNLVRGLSPYPAAFFIHNKKVIKVYRTEIVKDMHLKLSEFHQTKKELIVGCGKDAIKILEIQLEGKKRMSTEEFLRGYSFIKGSDEK